MVRFYSENTDFVFKQKSIVRAWLKTVIQSEIKKPGDINVIFCSDNYILDINIKYLGHDYFTDVITFDYVEKDIISGDIFVSVDSVRDNAGIYGSTFEEELHRVIVHGVLHLIGYDDHTDSDIAVMRSKEDYYLKLRKSLGGN